MFTDLTRFDRDAMQRCSDGLRARMADATTMEGAARNVCRYLHEELHVPDEGRAAMLVRCYRTQAYGALPEELQRYAKRAMGAVAFTPPDAGMKCLVLLATAGDEPAWNDRRRSVGHQAIPLPSPHIVQQAPMIAQLIEELGFEIAHVIRRQAPGGSAPTTSAGIFHVEEAAGSRYIPAQAGFVDRYGVRSVLGFGGALHDGDIGAVILFTRAPVPVASAERFRPIALELRDGLSRHRHAVYDDAAPPIS